MDGASRKFKVLQLHSCQVSDLQPVMTLHICYGWSAVYVDFVRSQ